MAQKRLNIPTSLSEAIKKQFPQDKSTKNSKFPSKNRDKSNIEINQSTGLRLLHRYFQFILSDRNFLLWNTQTHKIKFPEIFPMTEWNEAKKANENK